MANKFSLSESDFVSNSTYVAPCPNCTEYIEVDNTEDEDEIQCRLCGVWIDIIED